MIGNFGQVLQLEYWVYLAVFSSVMTWAKTILNEKHDIWCEDKEREREYEICNSAWRDNECYVWLMY